MKLPCKTALRGLLLLLCSVAAANVLAQTVYNPPAKKAVAPIRNLKVISEEPDGKGNIVRVVQYTRGAMRITETTITPTME